MILAFVALTLLQDPALQNPPPSPPVVAPPAQEKPARSREDRLEGRVAGDPEAKPETPTPEIAPAKPVDDPNAGWTRLNACVLIVNEEPVTHLDIQRGVAQVLRDEKRPKSDAEKLYNKVVVDRATELLEIQGGKDLGFDSAMIDRYVNSQLEREAEEAGSVTKLAQELKQEEKDSFARRQEVYARANRDLWSYSIIGTATGPGGRIWRDPFVRPGRALFNQREALRDQPASRMVQLTQLILSFGKPPAPGSQERVEKLINELRERVMNGEDMGELAEMYAHAAKGSRGLTPELPVAGLREKYPEVGAFLEKAEAGELSPVLPFFEDGKLAGYALLRPEEFKLAPVAPFDQAKTQQGWIEGQRQRLADERLHEGLRELLTAAYVWPPETISPTEGKP